MPRAATGHVRVKQTQRGDVYSLRLRVGRGRFTFTLGSSEDGWTLAKAEEVCKLFAAPARASFLSRRAEAVNADDRLEAAQTMVDVARFTTAVERLVLAQIQAFEERFGDAPPHLNKLLEDVERVTMLAENDLHQIVRKRPRKAVAA